MLRYLVAIFICVFLCVWIALFYRPTNTYLSFQMLNWFNGDFLVWRSQVQSTIPLTPALIYNLPGALWVFTLSLLGWRLRLRLGKWRFSLFPLGLLVGLLFECVQYVGMTDGTADYLDLFWNTSGFLAAWGFGSLMPNDWRAEPGYWRYVLFFVVFFAAFVVDVA